MGSIASRIRDEEMEAEAARERVQRPLLTRLSATREAGTVRRCHIVPHHGQYNIAQHSYGAVSLLFAAPSEAVPEVDQGRPMA
jgi:hypothetical protein